MAASGFALFATAAGRCGIAWSAEGIAGLKLPEARDAELRARMLNRFPQAGEEVPPPEAQQAIDLIVALLQGQPSDLASIRLDMEGVPPFHRRVYEVAREISPGTTLSYGEIAKQIGSPRSARAVGQALGRNPFSIIVPCHRVFAAGGKIGGFSAHGGIMTKLKLLSIEGVSALAPLADHSAAVAHLRAADPKLARLIDKVGPCRLRINGTSSLFMALAEAIVYQQLNGRAAATIFARVRALFPRPHEGPTAEQILRVSDEKLRGAGLSRSKMLSLRDLAQKSAAGEIPGLEDIRGMTDEAIIEHLTQVRGIGRWTVEMLLMFRLGRPDVLPVDDFGIRKGFANVFGKAGVATVADLEKRAEKWRPYRSVASWYLWRAADFGKPG